MSAAEVLSEEEEDGDTSVRGDNVDEDKEGSDAISFVMHDLFFFAIRDLFLSVLFVCGCCSSVEHCIEIFGIM